MKTKSFCHTGPCPYDAGHAALSRFIAISVVAAAASSDVLARAAARQAVTVGIVLEGHASAAARGSSRRSSPNRIGSGSRRDCRSFP